MGGYVLRAIGRPIPRRVLDATVDVKCNACGFMAEGVGFRWDEKKACGFCPKCGSYDLTPGRARL